MIVHTLLPLTASCMLGIIWQATNLMPWLVSGVIFLVLLLFAKNKQNTSLPFLTLLALFFAVGALRYTQQMHSFEQINQALVDKAWSAKARVLDVEKSYKKLGQTIFTLEIQELTHKDQSMESAKNCLVQVTTSVPEDIRPSDVVTCPLLYFRAITNHDYKKYLIKEQLLGQLYCQKPFTLLYRPEWSLSRWFVEKRNNVIEKLQARLSPLTFTLCASIFWGKKNIEAQVIDPIKEQFKIWGIIHYLARSGLHLVIFVILWNWIMSLMPLPFTLKHLILLGLIMGYLLLSWSSISFLRSVILFVFYKLCVIADLPINALYLLTLTCLLIIVTNPLQIFFLDFQLSFALTFALAFLSSLRAP